jgi:hypothetical protein
MLFKFKKGALKVWIVAATCHRGTFLCTLSILLGAGVHIWAPVTLLRTSAGEIFKSCLFFVETALNKAPLFSG